jgi:hypothetical protein
MSTNYKIILTDDNSGEDQTFEGESFAAVLREIFAVVAAVPEQYPMCDLATLLDVLTKIANEYAKDDTLTACGWHVGNPMTGTWFHARAEFPAIADDDDEFAPLAFESGEEWPPVVSNEETITICGRSVDVFYDEHATHWEAFCVGFGSVSGQSRDEVIDGMHDKFARDSWAKAAAQYVDRGGDVDDRHPTFESIWQNAPADHPYRLLFASAGELQEHARRLAKRDAAEIREVASAMGVLISE